MQFDDSYAQILRLNVAGSPIEWLTWQDATTLYARELVTWTLGDTVRTVWGGTSRLNGERSFIKLPQYHRLRRQLFKSYLSTS